MLLLMSGILIIYVLVVIGATTKFVHGLETQIDQQLLKSEEDFDQINQQKQKLTQSAKSLEKEATEIFTLYDMTSEITKKSNEKEAFKVFKEKLKQTAPTLECRYLPASSLESNELQEDDDQFIFMLKEKKRKLGCLLFKGLAKEDQEKIMILGHQFALALRRVKLYRDIEELAITDSLTGAHTRRYFMQRFEEELKRSTSRKNNLSFLIIDVDRFKNFNDKYGHLAGDQILKEIGSIIKDNLREIDILGRYGGEEFSIVLPDTDSKGAIYAAERIRIAVEKATISAYDATVKATLSLGASTFPRDGTITIELIDKADWALYRAKKKGRNCTCAFGVYN